MEEGQGSTILSLAYYGFVYWFVHSWMTTTISCWWQTQAIKLSGFLHLGFILICLVYEFVLVGALLTHYYKNVGVVY
jgi:hypothetical protein